MIDIKMKTLLTVAEEKNFTRTAEKLHLTQPAISHHIRELEDELHTQILIRKKGEIIPTATGEIVISYARRIQAIYEKMDQEIHNFQNRNIKIKIGITHTAESNLTTEVISSFLQNHPGISMTIITGTAGNLYQMIENYELDFAFVDQKTKNNLNYLPLDTDYLVCVVNNESPLVQKKKITIEELRQESLILRLPSSSTRILFDATLESINESIDRFKVILEVDNIATIKELIRKKMGVSILAKSACMEEIRKNQLAVLPIENLRMERKYYFIYTDDCNYLDIVRELSRIYHKMNQDLSTES